MVSFHDIAEPMAACSVVFDILCVLLPVILFRNLQISWKKKLGVVILLSLGLLYGHASLLKKSPSF